MAGLNYAAASGEITLTAATAKTLIQITAPANQAVKVKQINITGKQPAGGTDTPLKIRITRSTAGGTATAGTAYKLDPARGETIQSVVKTAFTIEPTTPTDTWLWFEFQPQSGLFYPIPFGQDLIIPGGGQLNVEATSGSTPIVLASIVAEE
jgi:hypothetical protein